MLQTPKSPFLPALALTLNAFVWGVSWWPFRELQAQGLHPMWVTACVYAFAALCILLARPQAWRGLIEHPLLWLLVLSSGLTNVGFNWAVTIGDVVRVVLLFYVMPAWSVLLAWPILGEKPTLGSLLRLVLSLAGVIIVLKTPGSPWPVPSGLADWLAVMGGFTFALTNVLLRRLNQTPEASRMLAMFGGGTAMAVMAAFLGMQIGLVSAPPAANASWLLLTGGLCVAFLAGNMALQYGASRLKASATSLIMLSEVVFASVSASLLGAGELTARTVLGGTLIVLSSLLSVLPGRKN